MTSGQTWVCRSCWKPNRLGAKNCYKCKTPRDADQAVVETRRRELAAKTSDHEARLASAAGTIGVLPAAVFTWYGRLTMAGGILILILIPLVLSRQGAPAGTVPVYLALVAGSIALGATELWAARAMRLANPWGFAVGIVASVATAAFTIYAMNTLPVGSGNPNWMRWITIAAFGFSGVLALLGLIASLRRRPTSA